MCPNNSIKNPDIVIFNTNICQVHYNGDQMRAHAGTLRLLPGAVPFCQPGVLSETSGASSQVSLNVLNVGQVLRHLPAMASC